MTRSFWVWLHRWVGLTMAGFLVIVGLTGSLLAFLPELNRWLTPELFPGPHAGVALDPATLARRAEALVPEARAGTVYLGHDGSALIGMKLRAGAPALSFDQLVLDPVTGDELGRRRTGVLPDAAQLIMPFVYRLHMTLIAGEAGAWILGLVALAWTLDCFVAFYLTLPASCAGPRRSFLATWKPAWLVKWRASLFRINFDLHRASGLWFWPMFLIFAWSSVYTNLNNVYTGVTRAAFDYDQPYEYKIAEPPPERKESLSWEEALAIGRALMGERARVHDFTVERELALYLAPEEGFVEYRVRSSRDIGDKYGQTSIWFDAFNGAFKALNLPTGHHAGNTLTTWIYELHKANLFGLPYKILVCVFGLVVAMLSGTGVYIWWKKREARKVHARRAVRAPT